MAHTIWQVAEANYGLTAEVDGVRAVVVRVDSDGTARFMLLKRVPDSETKRPMLVESGHHAGIRQAMEAAERALVRHQRAA